MGEMLIVNTTLTALNLHGEEEMKGKRKGREIRTNDRQSY